MRRLADEHAFAFSDVYTADADAAPRMASRAKCCGRCDEALD